MRSAQWKTSLECSLCDNFLARYADSRQLATPGLSNPLRHISPSEVSPAPVWRHQACAGWATAYPASIQGLMEESTWHCLFAHSRTAPVSRGRWRSASHPRGHGADPRIRPPSRLERQYSHKDFQWLRQNAKAVSKLEFKFLAGLSVRSSG